MALSTSPAAIGDPAAAEGLTPVQRSRAPAVHSRFVQRVRRRYEAELGLLPAGPPGAEEVHALIRSLEAAGRPLPAALRVARQLVIERLAVLDIEQGAPLSAVTATMTCLAEATLERALAQALADTDARHGPPLDATGRRVDFWIVGMGKLGARELNVSSDIDLVYVYEEDGHTTGIDNGNGVLQGRITVHEYFSHVARRLSTQTVLAFKGRAAESPPTSTSRRLRGSCTR